MRLSPERKFVPSVSASAVPSGCGSPSAVETRQPQQLQQQPSPHVSPTSPRPGQQPLLHPTAPMATRLIWVSDQATRARTGLTPLTHLGPRHRPPLVHRQTPMKNAFICHLNLIVDMNREEQLNNNNNHINQTRKCGLTYSQQSKTVHRTM